MVLESIYVLPRRNPASAPSTPHKISSTAGGSLTIVISTSTCAAMSRGFGPNFAPSRTSSSARAFVRFQTTKGNPALNRFPAIGFPISPNPINPTVGFICPPLRKMHYIRATTNHRQEKFEKNSGRHEEPGGLTPLLARRDRNGEGPFGTLWRLDNTHHILVGNFDPHRLLPLALHKMLFNNDGAPRVDDE